MQQESNSRIALPADAHIGRASLRVADIDRSRRFYGDLLGLEIVRETQDGIALGARGGRELIVLREVAGIERRPARPRTTGLYHVALLLPSRGDLGRALLGLNASRYQLRGLSDHAVSESIYLDDPDGNGLEIYADRPRSSWKWNGGKVHITVDPMDVAAVTAAAGTSSQNVEWQGLPGGTTIGHLHFTVSDLDEAVHFYRDAVGFDEVIRMPSLSGVSAGGYHHHLNLNTWAGAGAPRDSDLVAGLDWWELIVPDSDARNLLTGRLESHRDAAAATADPDGVRLRVVA